MPNLTKTDALYMSIAHRVARESCCQRKQVGAVLVTAHGVCLPGYNGTPAGQPNVCELTDLTTDPRVLHAESNCLSKALRAGLSTVGATLYVTLSPCIECAKLLVQAGVTRVVYAESYRCNKGLLLLRDCGIVVEQYSSEDMV